MQDLKVGGAELEKIISESIPKILKEKFSSSYGNPLADAIQEEIKSQDGLIKTYIRELIAEILTNEELKKKVANEIISQMIQKGLRG